MIKEDYLNKSIVSSMTGVLIPVVAVFLIWTTGSLISKPFGLTPIFYILFLSSVASISLSAAGILFYTKSNRSEKKSLMLGIVGIILGVLLLLISAIFRILFIIPWG